MEAEELLKYMLNFFQDIDKQIKEIENELSQKDLEQQDILHYIENNLNGLEDKRDNKNTTYV